MICRNPNCEKENPDYFEFCKYCGRRLRAPKNNSKRPLQIIAGIIALIILCVGVKALFSIKGKPNVNKAPETAKNNVTVQKVVDGVKGYKFAFVRGVNGAKEVYINNADGTITKLTNSNTLNAYPVISPDGTKVAFERKDGDTFYVYVIGTNGKGEKKLVQGHAPAWTADGTLIMYYVKDTKSSANVLCKVKPDGIGQEQVSKTQDSYFMTKYSPDGSKVAISKQTRVGFGIYCSVADLSATQTITSSEKKEDEPSWSADSTKIAYTSWKDGNANIYLVDMNKNVTQLTNTSAEEYSPSFTKDNKIIYTKNEAAGPSIYIMDANGANQKLFLKDAAYGSISMK